MQPFVPEKFQGWRSRPRLWSCCLDAGIRAAVFFLLLFVTVLPVHAAPLLSEVPQGEAMAADPPGTVLRSRRVEVDLSQLTRPNGAPVAPGSPLTLNLFENETYTATVTSTERHLSGGISLIGTLDRHPASQVMIVVHKGLVMATVTAPGLLCQIRPLPDGGHGVFDINPAAFPEAGEPVELAPPASPPIEGDTLADDGSLIDVLVVYTATTRQAAGSVAAIEALVDLAETETNTTFANSGINPRIRVVHSEEVAYSESGFNYSQALNDLRNGNVANALDLREQYGADLIVMLVEGDNSLCGLAFFMTTVTSSFASSAMSVTRRTCATGNLTFGHEIGHNLGARHQREVDNNDGPFTFNHGYEDSTNSFRTVMAISSGSCSSCPRIAFWSNPDVLFSGNPTGIAEGQPTAADNRKTLNQTAATAAAFREHVVPIAGDFENASSVVTPYWQAGNQHYTFIGLTHPSLSGMAGEIGVSVKAFLDGGGVFGPVAEFTLTPGVTSRLFIVPSGHASLNSGNLPTAQFITGFSTSGSGFLRIDPVSSTPKTQVAGGGYPDVTMLAYWGAVVFESGNTGFALEFLGDAADSASHPGQGAGRFASGLR